MMTTKLHLAITPDFHIVEGYLSGGNIADISCADDLTACVSGCYTIEDKGYDSNKHRIYLLSNIFSAISLSDLAFVKLIEHDKDKFKRIAFNIVAYHNVYFMNRLMTEIRESTLHLSGFEDLKQNLFSCQQSLPNPDCVGGRIGLLSAVVSTHIYQPKKRAVPKKHFGPINAVYAVIKIHDKAIAITDIKKAVCWS